MFRQLFLELRNICAKELGGGMPVAVGTQQRALDDSTVRRLQAKSSASLPTCTANGYAFAVTRSFGTSDVGRRRELNEDAFLCDDALGLYLVNR